MTPGLPPPRPIPIKDRSSFVWVGRGRIDVEDGALVVADEQGVRMQIPIGALAVLFLEPGAVVTHEAVKLAARVGCLLVWIGDGGVRLYAAGQPGGARSDRLLHQARLALDEGCRLKVVRKMYALRFGEEPPERRSLDQLRGMEAARVKRMYELLATQNNVAWHGRRYDPKAFSSGDVANICLSAANACLYGVCEAAILAAGYAPAIGFLHTGKPQSFVYDIADIVKFETSVPAAFRVAAQNPKQPEREARIACRDLFLKGRLLKRIVPLIEDVLTIDGVQPPSAPPEALPVAIEQKEQSGDAGHRS
ncbi:type I-E CRISPR-associated endonuclease Cas1e [Azospirillum soli]|uniref:type I-E CRISPR-associated endonuclease Cas1e n=1 Tax=Azospirillum soli TaxID=1304799 RepID=UPI001AE87B6C|nr:type I-E CRISPR-associated endonuclease Cas1e [Azospirillum soli]MBP2315535.1 CRISPR-associated protein Cas1 [Azospirillum soli]